jgi:hypothetical protein
MCRRDGECKWRDFREDGDIFVGYGEEGALGDAV